MPDTITVFVTDANDDALTGDAANITCQYAADGGSLAALADTNPTEIGGGYYRFDLTAAEHGPGDRFYLPVSSTTDADAWVVGGNTRTVAATEVRDDPGQLVPFGPSYSFVNAGTLVAHADHSPTPANSAHYTHINPVVLLADELPFDMPTGCYALILDTTYHIDAAEGGGISAYWLRGTDIVDEFGQPNTDVITNAEMVSLGLAPSAWAAGYPTTTRILAPTTDSSDDANAVVYLRGDDGAGYVSFQSDGVGGNAGYQASFLAKMVGSPISLVVQSGTFDDALDIVVGVPGGYGEVGSFPGDGLNGYHQVFGTLPGRPGTRWILGNFGGGGSSGGAMSGRVLIDATDLLDWKIVDFRRFGFGNEALGLPDGYRLAPYPSAGAAVVEDGIIHSISSEGPPNSGGAPSPQDLYETLWDATTLEPLTKPRLILPSDRMGADAALRFNFTVLKRSGRYWVLYGHGINASNESSLMAAVFVREHRVAYEARLNAPQTFEWSHDFLDDPGRLADVASVATVASGTTTESTHGLHYDMPTNGRPTTIFNQTITPAEHGVIEVEVSGLASVDAATTTVTNPFLSIFLVSDELLASEFTDDPRTFDGIGVGFNTESGSYEPDSERLTIYEMAIGQDATLSGTATETPAVFRENGCLLDIEFGSRSIGFRWERLRKRLVVLADGIEHEVITGFAPTIDPDKTYRLCFMAKASAAGVFVARKAAMRGYSDRRLRRDATRGNASRITTYNEQSAVDGQLTQTKAIAESLEQAVADLSNRTPEASYRATTLEGSTATVLLVAADPPAGSDGKVVRVDDEPHTIESFTVAAGGNPATITLVSPGLVEAPDAGTFVTIAAGQSEPVDLTDAAIAAVAAAGTGGPVSHARVSRPFQTLAGLRDDGSAYAESPINIRRTEPSVVIGVSFRRWMIDRLDGQAAATLQTTDPERFTVGSVAETDYGYLGVWAKVRVTPIAEAASGKQILNVPVTIDGTQIDVPVELNLID